MTAPTAATAPLEGVRVLEVAIYAFVPSAVAILADWGADVVKVEHPVTGDPGRNTAAWGVPAEVDGVSHLWEVANRGKRAIALDLATPDGKAILLELVDRSDVFATNFLPAARRKLGIEPEDILDRNPRIVYAGGARRAHAARPPSEVASTPSRTGDAPARRSASRPPTTTTRSPCRGPASVTSRPAPPSPVGSPPPSTGASGRVRASSSTSR